jgi:hypothetical protein
MSNEQILKAKGSNNGFPYVSINVNSVVSSNHPIVEFLNAPTSNDFDVIVSFATHKIRIEKGEFYQSFDSIVNQKFNGKYHVVANLWKPDYENAPQKLKDYFKEHNIEVILTDQNYKTHNKYCFVFEKYKGIPIATFDDD